jgi:putative transcriptional regulator
MSGHTAPEELLLDYAAGGLAEGPALAVAVHVALDAGARQMVDRLGMLAGALLDDEKEAAVGEEALRQTLARLDGVVVESRSEQAAAAAGPAWAPPPLRRYLGAASKWQHRRIGGFDERPLHLHDGSHRASLLRLEPGRGLPQHRHIGAEYTVVLQGGFTDTTGSYAAGDFCVGPDEIHEPIADAGEPCIALIVLANPFVLSGPIGRYLNPLVRRGWL